MCSNLMQNMFRGTLIQFVVNVNIFQIIVELSVHLV